MKSCKQCAEELMNGRSFCGATCLHKFRVESEKKLAFLVKSLHSEDQETLLALANDLHRDRRASQKAA